MEFGISSIDVTCFFRGFSVFVGVFVFVLVGLIVFCVWMKMRRIFGE